MTDLVLFIGRLLLLALVYLFLFAAVRTGVGMVSGAAPDSSTWRLGVQVVEGPPELRGVKLDLADPVRIGREPDSELVIADGFVSGRHARIDPSGSGPVLKDLGSTNGTFVNGKRVQGPVLLAKGDRIEVGKVVLEVRPL
ncbi:MAG: FHA domain-containing protein [Coriobacteriia bacterium]